MKARGATLAGLGLVAILAVFARLARISDVLMPGTILPLGPDSSYHFRRIFLTIEQYPFVPVFDPWMNWPDGGFCHWAPGFDFIVASFALLFPSEMRVMAVAAAPMLMGLALVALCMRTTTTLKGGVAEALAAGVLMAVNPEAVSVSIFSRVDHHVLEAIAMAALGLWAIAGQRVQNRLAFEIIGTALVVFGLLTFAGTVVYVAVASVMLFLVVLARREAIGAPAFAAASVLSYFVTLPQIAVHGHPWSYVFPSMFQPALVAVAAAVLWVTAAVVRGGRERQIAVVATVAGAALVAVSPLVEQFIDGLTGWMLREDPWLAGIDEFRSALGFDAWADLTKQFGILGPAMFLVVPAGLWVCVKRDRQLGLLWAVWTLLVWLLAMHQVRFGRVFVLNLCVCAAMVIAQLQIRLRWPAAVTVGIALAIAFGDPRTRQMHTPPAPRTNPPAVLEAALFLRDQPWDGQSGVVAPWYHGHDFLWLGRRPVVSTGFGTYLDPDGYREVERAWGLTEPALLEWMARRQLSVLLSGTATYWQRRFGSDGSALFVGTRDRGVVLDPRFLNEYPIATTTVGGSGLYAERIPHLQQFTPIFASSDDVFGLAIEIPAVWLYEVVRGARVVGTVGPNEDVVVRTSLLRKAGPVGYEAWTTADPEGRFELVLPVANDVVGQGFSVASDYQGTAGDSRFVFRIGLDAVSDGRTVEIAIDRPR